MNAFSVPRIRVNNFRLSKLLGDNRILKFFYTVNDWILNALLAVLESVIVR